MARTSEVSLKSLLGHHCQLTLLSEVSTNKTKTYDFVSKGASIVNSEIFASILFSRNFAYAKFRENKILAKWRNHSVVY